MGSRIDAVVLHRDSVSTAASVVAPRSMPWLCTSRQDAVTRFVPAGCAPRCHLARSCQRCACQACERCACVDRGRTADADRRVTISPDICARSRNRTRQLVLGNQASPLDCQRACEQRLGTSSMPCTTWAHHVSGECLGHAEEGLFDRGYEPSGVALGVARCSGSNHSSSTASTTTAERPRPRWTRPSVLVLHAIGSCPAGAMAAVDTGGDAQISKSRGRALAGESRGDLQQGTA